MISTVKGWTPKIHKSAYIHPSSEIIGDVTIAEDASIWPLVTIRADYQPIKIGRRSNVQDNSVLHVDTKEPLIIGENVSIAHSVVVHSSVVEDECIIGMGAILLTGCVIGKGSIIGAGAVITEGAKIPPNSLVLGVPGKVVREATKEQRKYILDNAEEYVQLKKHYIKKK